MKIEYVAVADGTILDTITIGLDGKPHYATGKAADVFDSKLALGYTPEQLSSWSNGYVQTRPAGR